MAQEVIVLKKDGLSYTDGEHRYFGEVFDLRGFRNDRKLIDIGYLERYDESAHDHSDEFEADGKRFITHDHFLGYRRILHEEAELGAAREAFLKADPEEIETRELERRGLTVSKQRGPHQVSMAGLAEEPCPIDGCTTLPPSQMRHHIETVHKAPPADDTLAPKSKKVKKSKGKKGKRKKAKAVA